MYRSDFVKAVTAMAASMESEPVRTQARAGNTAVRLKANGFRILRFPPLEGKPGRRYRHRLENGWSLEDGFRLFCLPPTMESKPGGKPGAISKIAGTERCGFRLLCFPLIGEPCQDRKVAALNRSSCASGVTANIRDF